MNRFVKTLRHSLVAAVIAASFSTTYAQSPVISIPTQGGTYIEGAGLCFNVQIANPVNTATSVQLTLGAGTTLTPGSDFTVDQTQVVFPANFEGNMSACFSTLDDALIEPVEFIVIQLANPTNNATITDGTIAFAFYDNDSITTTYPCQQPFISEYVHSLSAGDLRALEIYNPATTAVDLAAYNVKIYHNGASDPTLTIPLSGTLAPGAVFVLNSPTTEPLVTAVSDLSTPLLNYTGDDAVALFHGDQLVDVIGVIGQDPGLYWPAGYGATASSVLVRDSVARQGETSWYISAGHWRNYSQSNFTLLGTHLMLPCGGGAFPPLITMITSDAVFEENIGGLGISVALYYPKNVETTVNVVVSPASTATVGSDFEISPTTLAFPANYTGSQGVGISVFDDSDDESNETIVLMLTDPSNGAVLLDSVWVLTLLDNDLASAASEQNRRTGVMVYPNPTKAGGSMTIALPEGIELQKTVLYDLSGRMAATFTLSGNKIVLPSDLAPGLYLLSLQTDEGVFSQKVKIRG